MLCKRIRLQEITQDIQTLSLSLKSDFYFNLTVLNLIKLKILMFIFWILNTLLEVTTFIVCLPSTQQRLIFKHAIRLWNLKHMCLIHKEHLEFTHTKWSKSTFHCWRLLYLYQIKQSIGFFLIHELLLDIKFYNINTPSNDKNFNMIHKTPLIIYIKKE